MDGLLSQLADAHFWAGQIGHQGDFAADRLRGGPQFDDLGRVFFERAVREVQASHAHSRLDHLFQDCRRVACRPDGGNDLRLVRSQRHVQLLVSKADA